MLKQEVWACSFACTKCYGSLSVISQGGDVVYVDSRTLSEAHIFFLGLNYFSIFFCLLWFFSGSGAPVDFDALFQIP